MKGNHGGNIILCLTILTAILVLKNSASADSEKPQVDKPVATPTLKNVAPLLPVADLDKSIVFYTQKLGFKEHYRETHGEDKFAIVDRDGVQIYLTQKQTDVDLRNATARKKPDGYANYDLSINCIPGTLDILWKACRESNVAMPVAFEKGPVKRDYGVRDFSFLDPDGYNLVFCEPFEKADTEEKAKTDVWAFCQVIDRLDFETAKRLLAQNPALAKAMTDGGWTPLMSASRMRDVELVQTLLELGAKVNQRNIPDAKSGEGDNFALWFAANNKRPNRVEVAKLLIKYGARVNAFGEFGETPLHQAAAWGNVDIAEYLISVGANVNAESIAGMTPLSEAIKFGKKDVAEILRKHGAKEPPAPPGTTDDTALQKDANKMNTLEQLVKAIEAGNVADVKAAIKADPQLLNQPCDLLSRRPLHLAARLDRQDIVKSLLQAGADFYVADDNGQLALDVQPGGELNGTLRYLRGVNDERNKFIGAVCDGNIAEVLQAIAADKSFANTVDIGSGSSALIMACFHGQTEIARILLENGADVHHLEWSTKTDAMYWSIDTNRVDCVALLLDQGADVERKWPVQYGSLPMMMNALHYATWKDRTEIVKLLLDRKADPNARAASYAVFSPLHFASAGHLETTRLLLEAGADITARDGRRALTALEMAELNKHEDVARLLREYKPPVKK